MAMTGSVDLGPIGLHNLVGRRLFCSETYARLYAQYSDYLPLLTGQLLAVLPDGPVLDIELRYTPQGRRLFIRTEFGRYKLYARNGRTWRVKKVPG